MKKQIMILLGLGMLTVNASGQQAASTGAPQNWYERFALKGYTQVRYDRLFESDTSLRCSQCNSPSANGGITFRRVRFNLSGQLTDRISMYFQPDFATTLPGSGSAQSSNNFVQLKDLYFDYYLENAKTLRARVGLSKVPFGWENMQSSSNRLAFERTDAINSATPGERDTGVFFYWTPTEAHERFKKLQQTLKGTGDYGVLGLGIYNGDGANRTAANNGMNFVARADYPFELGGGQVLEAGVQGYTGRFSPATTARSTTIGQERFEDWRTAANLILYPQPIGFQAEAIYGRGPSYNSGTNTIETQKLHGGYLQVMGQIKVNDQSIMPYARAQHFEGGKKGETDARHARIRELETGIEWQLSKAFEITGAFVMSDRQTDDAGAEGIHGRGNLGRVQLQFNY